MLETEVDLPKSQRPHRSPCFERPRSLPGSGSIRQVCCAFVLITAAAPVQLAGQDRLVRQFSGERGPPTVLALAQDSVGFIWAGSRAGLFRYDGSRFERWRPDLLPRAVGTVTVSPDGTVVVVDADGRILELTSDGVRQRPGAGRRSPEHTQIATFDAAGGLWVVTLEGVVAREEGAGWSEIAPAALAGDTARKLFAGGPDGSLLVAAGRSLWRITAGSPPQRLLEGHRIVDAMVSSGVVLALSAAGEIIRIDPHSEPIILVPAAALPGRAISMAEREGTLWVGTDHHLIAIEPDGAAEVLGPERDIAAGGPLLVDHEGSLWHAGFTTLSHYPEPATRVWNARHGLPSPHTRFVSRSGDVLWVTTWAGAGYLRLHQRQWQAGTVMDWHAVADLCSDDDAGGLFVGTSAGIHHLRGTDAAPADAHATLDFNMCSPALQGGHWIASPTGLHHLSRDGASLTPIRSFPFAEGGVQVVLEDRSGRLWAGSREQICESRATDVLTGGDAEWSCEQLPPGTVHLNSLIELPSGTIWGASHATGMVRHTGGRWELLEDNARLPTRSVLNLARSPRGGVWLVGTGILHRVTERDDGSGWAVLERLGAWHGLPTVGGGDLLEEEDGTIWIATAGGVVHLPAVVRSAEPPPPRMALVEARIDGERVPLTGQLVLPADRNRLELRFAAMTFRDPGRIRYQVRLSPGDEWADTQGQPFFNWVDLPPGRHRPQVRASLDGLAWSPEPAELAFRVLPPWYRTGWAIALFAMLAATLLFGLYRARLIYLIGLERQRTRIAMDLHDEMGSGLASIGILAGVMSDGGREPDGIRIAEEVARTAEELGTALSDIVWSLDPHSATLDELASRLAEHGGRLFADHVQFDTDFPDEWPLVPLPLPVLRNVLLIGLEALHNAARHAGAEQVVLSLRPDGGGWRLRVRDDGTGLPPGATGRAHGRGLRAMRRRASGIGGHIRWSSAPGQGTTVELYFRLAPRHRLFQWLRTRTLRPHAAVRDPHEHAGARTDSLAHR